MLRASQSSSVKENTEEVSVHCLTVASLMNSCYCDSLSLLMVLLARKYEGSVLTIEGRSLILEVIRMSIVVGAHRKSVPKKISYRKVCGCGVQVGSVKVRRRRTRRGRFRRWWA